MLCDQMVRYKFDIDVHTTSVELIASVAVLHLIWLSVTCGRELMFLLTHCIQCVFLGITPNVIHTVRYQ